MQTRDTSQTFFPLPGLKRETDRFKKLLKIAGPRDHILIKGPRGSGKSYFTQVYQERYKKELERINCANLPPSLLTSELFGHMKGAFTGADVDKYGLVVAAHRQGKALLLEEINSLDRKLPY
ncbi:MAG TPA: hypothetical protein DDW94_05220 [Deltaproteobacteria bacterium]|nr:MAG: hypothetical protein A2Z79_11190 [Deltaproteobacteria bacterium GWA2_55_82]OGQ64398.1 MAG: hypothetical protein A3I81_02875 [Deltaproteobacteria bacterium RIFCSPLOWO2_02_FULL_55_12]OGQ72742.1 MAG: hypothetical protein A2235_00745 [Deltaproteobacteria bacterium RIFOXYA2_FULL_42_10]OIJ72778.1 MAG: hypothetical protein A2V21_300015 [Deltaproteobacteria bacterium GWC2_55_46]HBG46374.1 hypothetical protein [Deltaproteobacteria bacterium]